MLGLCNTANYNSDANWNGLNGNVTTVGSNGKSSYYGTYDQTGNINELLDTNNGNWKIFRGGSFLSTSGNINKNYYDINTIDLKRTDLGFRIAKTSSSIDAINYVLIQNSSNVNDSNNIGRVDYDYQINKHPVTNSQYVDFLNAVNQSSNSLGLWVLEMSDSSLRGGIDRSGSSPNYTYTVKSNMGNKPVNFINWFNAARYINWLHNNKPIGAPSNSTTENGVYTLTNFVNSGSVKPSRNNTNSYWLPNENEWYKAAYYDPTKNGIGDYWNYATQSDSLPDSVTSDSVGTANGTINPNNCITPTPTPTVSVTTTPTLTPSVSSSVTPTPTITLSPTKTVTISLTPTKTTTPSVTTTKTPTRTIAITSSITPTNTITKTPTRSVTPTKTSTLTPTKTSTVTPSPSKSMVSAINIGQLIYQNNVYLDDTIKMIYKGFYLQGKLEPNISILYEAPNVSPTQTPTHTPTPTPTISVSVTPTVTISVTPSLSVSTTPTQTPTISISPSVSPTITPSITRTNTPSTSITSTPTLSITPSITPSNTITVTPTNTITTTPSYSVSSTITPTPTVTPTQLPDTNVLAVGYNSNKSAKSIDGGVSWTINNMPSIQYWTSVTKDNSKYVACAYSNNNIYLSNDGVAWTSYSLSNLTSSNNLWMNLIYGNGIFIMTPNDSAVAARSTNGSLWNETYLPAFANWKGGSYGNNRFLVVAENSSTAATSSDGNTWTMRSMPVSKRWLNVAYLNGSFIIIADNSDTIAYTADGINWNTSTLPTVNDWYSIAYGNNTYIILALDGSISRSGDLNLWQNSSIISGSWKSIIYKDKFIALGTNIAYTSINGITWTQRTIGNYQWFDVV